MPDHADLIAEPAGHRSPRLTALGVPHIFGTRRHPVQTATDARTLADAAGLAPGAVHLSIQCHGRGVTTPQTREPPPGGPASADGEPVRPASADAHLAERPGDWVAVRTADCVPVLLAGADGRCVAAVHAGWRGLVAGVIEAAAHAMTGRGAPPVAAAVGPCIGVAHYEVGDGVAAQFDERHLDRTRGPKPHLDLRRAAAARLHALGLAAADLDVSTACTHRDHADFFSYRRATSSGAVRGHQAAIIGVRPRKPRPAPRLASR